MDNHPHDLGMGLAIDDAGEHDQESVQLCQAVDSSGIAEECPKGLRRWGRGCWTHDWAYWSFKEYFEWVQTIGLVEDQHGNQGYWAAALDLWKRSKDKEQETETLRQTRAANVGTLDHMPLQELIGGNVVLEVWEGGKNMPGNSLRVCDDGEVDFLGGMGSRSNFAVEVVAAALPKEHVHLRSNHTGGYLRFRENDGGLDCHGSPQNLEGTIFEVFVRDSPTPLLSFGAKGGKIIGTLVPRKADVARIEPWWREGLLVETLAWMEADPQLRGKRRHIDDPSCKFYSFEEFVIFADEKGWGGPLENGALLMAKLLWQRNCIPEVLDPKLQGRRWHPRDANHLYYSFQGWVAYVQEQHWANNDGVIALAVHMWERELLPQEEDKVPTGLPTEGKQDISCAMDNEDWDMVDPLPPGVAGRC